MTKTVKSMITLAVVLILGIGLSIGTHLIFNPIKEERAKQETLSILDDYFTGVTDFEGNKLEVIEGVEILRSVRVYKNEDPLGYLYEANITNDFGNMKVRLSVDVKDVIQTIDFLELNQTMYLPQTTKMLETYVLSKLSTDIFDGAAGATSISKNDLSHLMSMVGSHHDKTDKFEIQAPYKEFYGDDYVISNTEELSNSGATIKVETIEGLGVVYTITKSGIYQTDSTQEKSITLVLALNNDNKIIGVLLPAELYNHTKGGFMTSAMEFAQSFKDTSILDVTDGNAGPTGDGVAYNSRTLIEDMVLIVQGVHISWKKKI